jgi:uracil-DNA glycosylase
LMQQRGQVFPSPSSLGSGEAGSRMRVVATIHPSAVLRAPDSEGRRAAYDSLVADLKVVAKVAEEVRR